MKKKVTILVFFILCFITSVFNAIAEGVSFSSSPESIETAADSVFYLEIIDNKGKLFASGSGFLLFDNTTLVTNYHVIEGASDVIAESDDGCEFHLNKVLIANKEKDIAILQFESSTSMKPLIPSESKLRRGETVVAIGSPEGLKNTVSDGIISYVGEDYIQFTASISHGSSGGALFNDSGEVIGVTSSALMKNNAQNLNFAIPIREVTSLYKSWDKKTEFDINELYNARTDIPKAVRTPKPTLNPYTPKPSPTPVESIKNEDAYIVRDNVKVFRKANIISEVVCELSFAEKVFIIDDSDYTFCLIQMENGMTGYVAKSNLKLLSDGFATPSATPLTNQGADSCHYGNNSAFMIQLNEQKMNIYVGEDCRLTAKSVSLEKKHVPTSGYNWTSADTAIARVENGHVVGIAPGETKIICTSTVDPTVYSSCIINVLIPTSSIELDENYITMLLHAKNEDLYCTQLQAIIQPSNASSKTISWTSSNPNVATVDENGNVLAVGRGTAKITANVIEPGRKRGPKAECKIVVKEAVQSISGTGDYVSFVGIGKYAVLKPAIEPKNADNKTLLWTSSNESIAVVDSKGKVQGVGAGECEIICEAADGGGASLRYNIRTVVTFDSITVTKSNITLKPNQQYDVFNGIKYQPVNADLNTISWSSSNPSVAIMCNQFNLLANRPGTATITGVLKDGSNRKLTLRIKVTK
ncbi:MAG: Ig-like domain-containing protein [Clostridia bacterium]|nr:Ig-like domain-containing protein [Clostridia bacterium]